MKIKYLFPLILLLLCISCTTEQSLKVISFNIRYDTHRDRDNAWPNRKELAVEFIREQSPDIFGLQEALKHQYIYMDTCLKEYSSIGVGRTDGLEKGEMNPVFFRTDRFEMLESNTFWLSETPGIPGSKGWGAALPRIVTWVHLKDNRSRNSFYYFNTHFSHMSDSARLMSSKILSEQVLKISGDSDFVITGDFNMLPDSEAYAALTSGKDNPVVDCYLVSEEEPAGVKYTFNGFRNVIGLGRIDYIFSKRGMIVEDYAIHNVKSGEIFISDHWPVSSTIGLR